MDDNKIQELWDEYKNLLLSTKRANIEKLLDWLDKSDFKYAPASTQYHCSYKGGLLQHSLNVYYAMYDFQPWIDFFELSDDTIKITALLHDICKVNCYDVSTRNTKNDDGQWITVPYYSWNELEPLGHGSKSVMLINEYGVELTKVERVMILNHMGFAADDLDSRRVGKLFRLCPQSLILHNADLEATMVLESYDGPERYINKISDKNITDSLKNEKKEKEYIEIDGIKYKLAKNDDIIDGNKIIELKYNDELVKVYSPYGDGLPF